MLPRYGNTFSGAMPEIKKYIDGKDASDRGTLPAGKRLRLEVTVPRRLGDGGVVLRIHRDGEEERDIPLVFTDTCLGKDKYVTEIEPPKGLYYWHLLFLRGWNTLFTRSINNRDFSLSEEGGEDFCLLVYEEGKSGAPDWFTGSVMYQIFPDRFAKGRQEVPKRADAVLEQDWYESIPEYAEKPGGTIKNNRFFGGTLYGICEKLDYIKSLGVGVIYLNPIFEAYSNHKYDTGDYERVDEMFGGDAALKKLLREAKKKGIRVILDGVFNHTGSDSKYFNKNGRYDTLGAYDSVGSPYHDWYWFGETRNDYESWWGIKILPKLDHRTEACRHYFTGKEGIGQRYVKMGTGGWRLDVADELSDSFLDEFRDSVKSADPDTVIIGEVWENAADKIAYGYRRRYFQDGQLDSVMNYPFRYAVVDFCSEGRADRLYNTLTELYASYPPRVCDSLMNILGTHDTERVLTQLEVRYADYEIKTWDEMTGSEKAHFRLDHEQYAHAVSLLKMASVIQYTVYGIPSLYYGDEAGMEGFSDPFCRMPYPWGREDKELLAHYRRLGEIRQSESVFKDGSFKAELMGAKAIRFAREKGDDKIAVLASREQKPIKAELDGRYKDLITGDTYDGEVIIAPDSARILKRM